MSFRFTENGIRKGIALVLVGTIAGAVSYGQMANTVNGNNISKCYYYNEDVKRNKEELMSSIESGSKGKTFEKKRDLVPKTIKR